MSSRREVLIRILALLRRKTLLETHYSTVQSLKNVAVVTEDGGFALFFRPHPGGFDSSSPHPREFAIQGKKMLMPGGHSGGKSPGRNWN